MSFTWSAAIVYLAIASSAGAVMLLASRILRVRSKQPLDTQLMTYECGEEPSGKVWIRFNPRYYVIALIFVLFDIEVIFLVPWALKVRSLGGFAIVEMLVFTALLLLAWAYALKKGALTWQ